MADFIIGEDIEDSLTSEIEVELKECNAGLVKALSAAGITSLTPVQKECLPHGLAGKDLLAKAKTGTGKTLGAHPLTHPLSYITLYHPISPYIPLYHPISPYITLYHPIPPYTTLYHPISPYITLYHPKPPYTTLYHTISHCTTLHTLYRRFLNPCCRAANAVESL